MSQWEQGGPPPPPPPPGQQQYAQGPHPPSPKKRVPAWAIVLIVIGGLLVAFIALAIVGAIFGEDEGELGENVDPADRAVCLSAAGLANASRGSNQSLVEVAAQVERLRAVRGGDAELEAHRAELIRVVDQANQGGTLTPELARQSASAGERLGQRCVELKAVARSDLEPGAR